MEDEKPKSLNFYISRTATLADVLELCIRLDQLYKSMGGDALDLSCADCIEEAVYDSEFEQHAGSQFANSRRVVKDIPFGIYHVSRDEVYDAIQKLARPEMTEKFREDIDRRFPREVWGDQLPKSKAFAVLFNEYLRDNNIME